MGKRGSEHRQKTRSVLVRLSEREFTRLTGLVENEGTSRAEYFRHRFRMEVSTADGGEPMLSDHDRAILAGCHRSMGHLAGIMKRAVFELPPHARPGAIETILDDHHRELQAIQKRLLAFLDEHTP